MFASQIVQLGLFLPSTLYPKQNSNPCQESCTKLVPFEGCSTEWATICFVVARTRWVRSTFSSHCLLSSNQRRWLASATSIIFRNAGNWTPGLLGEKQVCYLCALQPSSIHHTFSVWNPLCSNQLSRPLLPCLPVLFTHSSAFPIFQFQFQAKDYLGLSWRLRRSRPM